jgi:hypothetical protein
VKIAPCHGKGEGLGSGIEVQKRLFLHRVYMHDAWVCIGKGKEITLQVYFCLAPAPSVRGDHTGMGASVALNHAF